MKKYCAVISLLFTVCSVDGQTSVTPNENFEATTLYNDIWIWGIVNASTPQNESQIFLPLRRYEPIEEECVPDPPVPDFTAPGRRISEVKCLELIWKLKVLEGIEKKPKTCPPKRKHPEYGEQRAVLSGRNVTPGEFPHMGAIGWQGTTAMWEFKCGGSLISSKFVLTAAHCRMASPADTSLLDPIPKIVRLSHINLHITHMKIRSARILDTYDIPISRIISHPYYNPPEKYYDIALIELEKEVGFHETVLPACLWGHQDVSTLGTVATITGWGVLEEGGSKISQDLQAGDIDLIDENVCSRLLGPSCNRHWCGVRNHQICAGKLAGGVDACSGDSGGPLQVKIKLDFQSKYKMYYVIGVTSFGVGCGQPDTPGIYTRVSSFIDWIEQIVWPPMESKITRWRPLIHRP